MAMKKDNGDLRSVPSLSRRERLRALLFTAGSIGTTLLTLGMLADVKLPRNQGE